MAELVNKRFVDIEVGEEIPRMSFTVTQDHINKYANVSKDFNPLHIDEEFAKNTPFKGTIAHGLMTLAFISHVMTKWHWNGWVHGGCMDVTFISPLRPNESVTIGGIVAEKDEITSQITVELDVKNTNGNNVVVGKTQFSFN
jgi:3-hydroxybutyryl-CoA dehydratase